MDGTFCLGLHGNDAATINHRHSATVSSTTIFVVDNRSWRDFPAGLRAPMSVDSSITASDGEEPESHHNPFFFGDRSNFPPTHEMFENSQPASPVASSDGNLCCCTSTPQFHAQQMEMRVLTFKLSSETVASTA